MRGRSESKKVCSNFWAYQKEGHYRKDYPNPKQGLENSNDGEIDMIRDQFENSNVLSISIMKCDREWVLDLD